MEKTGCHFCCDDQKEKPTRAWYFRPLFLTLFVSALLVGVSYWASAMESFRHEFFRYLEMLLWPVSLGIFLGGLLDYYVPREYISKHLAHKGRRTILLSASLGILMSACSHGIIAMAMELHKKGASVPAVISFLLASPWASLPITLLLIGFFGWKAFVIVFSAFLIAVITGFAFQALERKHGIEENPHTVPVADGFSVRRDILRRFRSYRFTARNLAASAKGIALGMYDLTHMIVWWVLLGVVLASIAGAFVPSQVFQNYFGPDLRGLFMTMGLATVLEVCSECTSPLAFEIYRHTLAFGNAFVFLMGGVVTDYTEVGLVWMRIGKKTALWMLAITIPQVLLLGWLYNRIF